MPMAEELPPSLLASLGEGPARVLVSGNNLGSHGLRTLDLLPAQAVRMALDHLAAAGHRRLLVFNVQPRDAIIGTRIDEAQVWARSHPEVTVTIAGEAVASGEKTLPAARIQARQLLHEQHPTAVLALTLPAAQGMIRVAVDSGLPPGRAFAVATIDGEGIAEELVPSITSVDLDPVDLSHLLAEAVTWMRGADWPGTKAHACQPVLHVRESTDGVR